VAPGTGSPEERQEPASQCHVGAVTRPQNNKGKIKDPNVRVEMLRELPTWDTEMRTHAVGGQQRSAPQTFNL
jgi:hypothetical protein